MRPVCLYVDGSVPSCDHIHNNNYHHDDGERPKNGGGGGGDAALNGRRLTTDVDYESYFIEPSRPNAKIE